jgi:hypothetical protein
VLPRNGHWGGRPRRVDDGISGDVAQQCEKAVEGCESGDVGLVGCRHDCDDPLDTMG